MRLWSPAPKNIQPEPQPATGESRKTSSGNEWSVQANEGSPPRVPPVFPKIGFSRVQVLVFAT